MNLALAVLLFLGATSEALAQRAAANEGLTTANQILKSYSQGDQSTRQIIEYQMSSFDDAYGWANAELKSRRKQEPLYCPPDKMALTGNQLLDVLRREVKDRPKNGEFPVAMTLLVALQHVFPCP